MKEDKREIIKESVSRSKGVRSKGGYFRDSSRNLISVSENFSGNWYMTPVSYTHLTLPTNREV